MEIRRNGSQPSGKGRPRYPSAGSGQLGGRRGMKYALISDIHANLPALEGVLQDVDGRTEVTAATSPADRA
jgi:hypothetical protein